MDINKEKEYIYMMLQNIHEERRRLTEMAAGFKNRLDELNRLEMQGIEELSVKGWVDLHNQAKKEVAATNISRETAFLEERMQMMIRQTLQDELAARDRYIEGQQKYGPFNYEAPSSTEKPHFPSMSETTKVKAEEETQKQEATKNPTQDTKKTELIDTNNQADNSNQVTQKQESSYSDEDWRRIQQNLKNNEKKALHMIEEESKPKAEESPAIKENKALTEQKRKNANSRRYDIDKIYAYIIQVLKEEGVPLKAQTIYERVQELYGEPIDKTNFTNNMMHRIYKKDKRISRPQRAYYQYNFSASL